MTPKWLLPVFAGLLVTSHPAESLPSKCLEEPFDKGSCDDKLLRWSYNDQWKGCSPFIFGGCGGNANNFNTQEECLQVCPSPNATDGPQKGPEGAPMGRANDIGSMPSSPVNATSSPAPGPTVDAEKSERSSKSINKSSKIDDEAKKSSKRCQDVAADAARRRTTDACSKPTKNSDDRRLGWTFDAKSKSCKSLPYSDAGCADTTNKFIDKQECTRLCETSNEKNKNRAKTASYRSKPGWDDNRRHHIRTSPEDWIESCSDYPVWVADHFRKHWIERIGKTKYNKKQSGYSYRRSTDQCVQVRDIVTSPTLNKFYTMEDCNRCQSLNYVRTACSDNPRIAPHACTVSAEDQHQEMQLYRRSSSRSSERWAYIDGHCVSYQYDECEPSYNSFFSKLSCLKKCKATFERRNELTDYGRSKGRYPHSPVYTPNYHHYEGVYYYEPYDDSLQGVYYYYLPHHSRSSPSQQNRQPHHHRGGGRHGRDRARKHHHLNRAFRNNKYKYSSGKYAPETYAPDRYAPVNYAPEKYENYAPEKYENYAPKKYENYAPVSYTPDKYENYAPESYVPDKYTYEPESYAPESYTSEKYPSYGYKDSYSNNDYYRRWHNKNEGRRNHKHYRAPAPSFRSADSVSGETGPEGRTIDGDFAERGPEGRTVYSGETGPEGRTFDGDFVERGPEGRSVNSGEIGPEGRSVYSGERGPEGRTFDGDFAERGLEGRAVYSGERGPEGRTVDGDSAERGPEGRAADGEDLINETAGPEPRAEAEAVIADEDAFDSLEALAVMSSQNVDNPRCKLAPPALGTCKDGQTLKPAHVFLDGECKEIVHNWCKGQVDEAKDNLFASKDDCIKVCRPSKKDAAVLSQGQLPAATGKSLASSNNKSGAKSASPKSSSPKHKNKRCAAPVAKILLCKNKNKFGKMRLEDVAVGVGIDVDAENDARGRQAGDEFDFHDHGHGHGHGHHQPPSADAQQWDPNFNDAIQPPQDYGSGGFGGGFGGGPGGFGGGPEGFGNGPGPEYGDYSQSRVGRRPNRYKTPKRKSPHGHRRPIRYRDGTAADPQLITYYSYDSIIHYPVVPITTTYESTYSYFFRNGKNGRGKRPNKKLARGPKRGGSRNRYPHGYRKPYHHRQGQLGPASSEAEAVSDPQYTLLAYDTFIHYPIRPLTTTTTTIDTYEYITYLRNKNKKNPNKKVARRGPRVPKSGPRFKKYPGQVHSPNRARASGEADKSSNPQDLIITYDTFDFVPLGYPYYYPNEYIEFYNGRSPQKGARLPKKRRNNKRMSAARGDSYDDTDGGDTEGKDQFLNFHLDFTPHRPYYYYPYGYAGFYGDEGRGGKTKRRPNRAPKSNKKRALRASGEDPTESDPQLWGIRYDPYLDYPYPYYPYYPYYFRNGKGKGKGRRTPGLNRAAKRSFRSELDSSDSDEKRKLRHASSEEGDDEAGAAVGRIAEDDVELAQPRAQISSGSIESEPRARGMYDDADADAEANRKKLKKRKNKSRDKGSKKRKNRYQERVVSNDPDADAVALGQKDYLEAKVRASLSSFEDAGLIRRKRSVSEEEGEVGEQVRGRMNEAEDDNVDDEAQRARSVLMAASRESGEIRQLARRVTEGEDDDEVRGRGTISDEMQSSETVKPHEGSKEALELAPTRRKREAPSGRKLHHGYTFIDGRCVKLRPRFDECFDRTENLFESREECEKACR